MKSEPLPPLLFQELETRSRAAVLSAGGELGCRRALLQGFLSAFVAH